MFRKRKFQYCEPCHLKSVLGSGGVERVNIPLDENGKCPTCGITIEEVKASAEAAKKKARDDAELAVAVARYKYYDKDDCK